jgi:hypothetical protein
MSRLPILAIALLFTCPATPAAASQQVRLRTRFEPDRLGASTTIVYGFRITTTSGELPSPVTDIDLHIPAGMGLATSTLGLATCEPTVLMQAGPQGCPASARIGYGSALVQVPLENETIEETASVEAEFGPPQNENFVVLFYVQGDSPISAQLVLPGELLPDTGPFSGRLNTAIPLIPTWPNGPDVALTSFSSTIGPLGLTYYKHIHGAIVPYHPRGIAVPARCPRQGFPFAADFDFADGTRATARSIVPCPHHTR